MINVIGSTTPPTNPLTPELPKEVAGGNVVETNNSVEPEEKVTESSSSDSKPPKAKKKIPKKQIIAVVALLLLLVGGGVGLYLVKLNQDVRQQASVYSTDECSRTYSAANCQAGQSDGDSCGPNNTNGTCRALPNQPDPDGVPRCTCDRPKEPSPTATSTCNEQCPGPDGVLYSCTPPEADGTSEDSICNTAGRVESCGGTEYCCSEANGAWTTDLTLCATSPTPTPTPTDEPTPTPTDTSNNTGGSEQEEITLPSELPQSGPEDWLQYLQIGLGTLGVGALLLLFL